MNITLGLKNWLNIAESNESLMLKYANTNELKYIKELVKRLEKDLYHYLFSQAGPDLAADISQIAWEKVIKNRRSYSETGSVKSWLFKIARSALIDELRRQQRWHYDAFDETTMPDEHQTEVDNIGDISALEQQQQFDAVFAQLPFLQREAFILQQEGFRLREISHITHCEIETIKSRLRYAKQTLITLIDSNEGE
jgi:RNA polymerase sigma factor (sigma-70 family)